MGFVPSHGLYIMYYVFHTKYELSSQTFGPHENEFDRQRKSVNNFHRNLSNWTFASDREYETGNWIIFEGLQVYTSIFWNFWLTGFS